MMAYGYLGHAAVCDIGRAAVRLMCGLLVAFAWWGRVDWPLGWTQWTRCLWYWQGGSAAYVRLTCGICMVEPGGLAMKAVATAGRVD